VYNVLMYLSSFCDQSHVHYRNTPVYLVQFLLTSCFSRAHFLSYGTVDHRNCFTTSIDNCCRESGPRGTPTSIYTPLAPRHTRLLPVTSWYGLDKRGTVSTTWYTQSIAGNILVHPVNVGHWNTRVLPVTSLALLHNSDNYSDHVDLVYHVVHPTRSPGRSSWWVVRVTLSTHVIRFKTGGDIARCPGGGDAVPFSCNTPAQSSSILIYGFVHGTRPSLSRLTIRLSARPRSVTSRTHGACI